MENVSPKNIKVLMVARDFFPNFGGAAIQAFYLSKELKKTGIDVDFVSDNREKRSAEDFFEGFRVFRISTFSSKGGSVRNFIFAVRLFIFILFRGKDYNIIHLHATTGYEALIFPLLKLLNKKIVLKLTLVGCDDPVTLKERKLGFLFFKGLSFADKLVAISKKLMELSLQSGIERNKITYIANGVNVNKFFQIGEQEKKLLKKRLGFDEFRKLFLAIGKIEDRKGYKLLMESWKFISMKFPSSAFLIAGPGNDETNKYYLSLKEIIQKEALQNVFFLGKIDNVDEYLKIADCFMLCSKREGLCNALVEAAVSSVPIACCYIEGVTEDIIQNQYTGRICYTESPLDFANLVVSLFKNQNKEKQEQAVEAIKKRFDMTNIALEYVELYRDILR